MNEERVSTVYPSVYHYTNDGGLDGILQTKSIWATHYRFLNDAKELLAFIEALQHFLAFIDGIPLEQQEAQRHNLDQVLYNLIEYLEKSAPHYLTCFCPEDQFGARNGRLSQWIKYGKDEGYAIEFDASKLEIMLKIESGDEAKFDKRYLFGVEFKTVGYWDKVTRKIRRNGIELSINEENDDTQTVNTVKMVLKETFDLLQTPIPNDLPDDQFQQSIHKRMEKLACSAARIKHYGFHEEREIRIIAPAVKQNEWDRIGANMKAKLVHFRPKDKAPYIVLFEEEIFDDLFKKAVKGIIIGPGNHQERREIKIQMMLEQYGYDYKKINIRRSDIPYVA